MSKPAYLDETLSFEQRARDLVARMTVQEAADQLCFNAPAIPRLGVKAYNWWNEALHGVARCGLATVFPQAIGLAATFDTEAVGKMAEIISTEGRAKFNAFQKEGDCGIYKGLTYWSPNVNIFRDPRWGRGQETYGEDPYLTSRLGVAFVKGLQGDDKRYLKAAGCAKHFAVHSGPEAIRHEFDAVASPRDMSETYLPAFEALCKEAKVEGFMGAYNRTNGEPCCASPALLGRTLREDWGFDGYTVSDCWAIADFHLHHAVTPAAPESAALALNNGCNLNCGNTYKHLISALEKGLITEELIRENCVRAMTTRMRLGLFDAATPWDQLGYEVVDCDAHRAYNLELSRKSLVLLKNDGLLPLNETKIGSIAVIGPNADNNTALVGNYHGHYGAATTVLEGLQQALPQTKVLRSRGCHLWKDEGENPGYAGDGVSDALAVARMAQAVVLCVGLDETIEGEEMGNKGEKWTGDKPDLLLPECQRILMEAVLKLNKPTIIVNMTGSAVDLGKAGEQANAVVQAFYPGAQGGRAVADLLLGRFSPSGRLPVTFYHNDDQLPDFTDYSMEGRTYKYFAGKPLYPFGFGLSYTRFEYSGLTLEPAKPGEALRGSVRVKNIGDRDGDEVVQVYIRHQNAPVRTPKHQLAHFGRVSLKAGEETVYRFELPAKSLALIADDGSFFFEHGRFTVFAGGSQPDERSQELLGTAPVKTEVAW